MTTFNGHRSWNAWNVSLWLSNDYSTYQHIMDLIKEGKTTKQIARECGFLGEKTPDGAVYNMKSLSLAIDNLRE